MNKIDKKIAVVLFNLGGPDSQESIKPFLFNFFMDKNIIRAPIFIRYFLAKLISIRRSKKEAGVSYAELQNRSPLLANSNEQAHALEKMLNLNDEGIFKTFVCMRYWHPMAKEIAAKVKDFNPDEIILLPLYPQFSTTTTRSSFQQWDIASKAIGLKKPVTRICCYPWDEGFVDASAENIKEVYDTALIDTLKTTGKPPRVLFSAHGLPEKIIKAGDPYQWQCEQSAQKIAGAVEKLIGIKNLDWQICYQSRVGPLKWIGPSTEEALEKAAEDKVPVVIFPHAFTQEHVETLVEIDMEYRALAKEMGVKGFYRVPTVGTSAAFIDGMASLVLKNISKNKTLSFTGEAICPNNSGDCCMRNAA